MKKIFSFGNNNKSRKQHSSSRRFQPQLEPLEDRQLLSVSSLLTAPATGTLSQSASYTEMDLRVDSQMGTAPVLGIRIDADSVGFNPSAISIHDKNGVKVSGNAIKYSNADFGGTSSSLLLVQLAPGDYKIRVGGDKSTFGSFKCDVFLPGDINHDGSVSPLEGEISNAVFLSSMGYLNYATISSLARQGVSLEDIKVYGEFDVDNDGRVSAFELEAATTNTKAGKVTVSVITDKEGPVIKSQLVDDDGVSKTDKITSKPAVTGTVTDESAIASFKASFNGGTNWTDITIGSNGAFTISNDQMKTMTGSPVDASGTVKNGKYTLTLNAVDAYGNATTYTFDYVVIANSTAPKAGNETFTTGEKEPLTNKKLPTPTDDDAGDVVTFVAETVTSSKGVSVVIKADGTFTYNQGDKFKNLNVGDVFADTFTYRVKDAMGTEGTGTITINITPVNDPPVAAAITETTNQDTNRTIDAISKATDPDNQLTDLSISAVTQPGKGEVKIENNKLVFYPKDAFKHLTGAADSKETVTFTYTIKDPGGLESTATVTLTVTGLYDAPKAVDDNGGETKADATLTIKVADLLKNDVAIDDGSKVEFDGIATQPAKGKVTLDNGNLVFDPNGDFSHLGLDQTETVTFTYRVKNDLDPTKTSTATVTVTVKGVNNPPVISGDYTYPTEITEKKDKIEISFDDLLALASDPNGDPMTISNAYTSTPGVTVSVNQTTRMVTYELGSAFYYLREGQKITDTFTFVVSDGKAGGTAEGKIKVNLIGVNDPLDVADQTLSVTSSGSAATISAGKVVVTDLDKGDTYEFYIDAKAGGPTGGTLPDISINKTTGEITFGRTNLPTETVAGQEYVLTVRVVNPNDSTDTKTATIKVKVVQKDPPEPPASVDPLNVKEDAQTPVTADIAGVKYDAAYTFDPKVTALSFTIDGVSYPIPGNISASISEKVVDGKVVGVLSFVPGGQFDLIPEGKFGELILEYTVKDAQYGVSATGTIKVIIEGVNSKPTSKGAIPKQTTDQDTNLTIDVLQYFSDPDVSDVLKIQGTPVLTGAGTVAVVDGKIVFRPGDAFKHLPLGSSETVTISFVVADSGSTPLTVNGTFEITVNGLNDAPVAKDDGINADLPATDEARYFYFTNRNATKGITNVLANDIDIDDGETATLVIGWIGRGTQGKDVVRGQATTINFTEGDSVTVAADGKTITYNPGTRYENNAKGTDETATFQYKAMDKHGALSNAATVSVRVKGINDPPKVIGQIPDYWQDMDTTAVIELSDYFSGQNLTYKVEKGNDPAGMVSFTLVGSKLTLTFTDNYYSQYTRDLIPFTVTATNSDDVSSSQTFNAATRPTTTAEIKVFAVDIADSIEKGRTASFDDIKSNTGTYKVGDKFYLEIWAVDLANLLVKDGFSLGISGISTAISFNGTVVKISLADVELSDQFAVEENPAGHDLDSSNAYIEKIGGGLTKTGFGLPGNVFRSARLLVEVIGEGDANFKVLPDSETSSTRFQISRQTDSVGDRLILNDDQIEVWVQTVSCVSASTPLLAEERPEVVAEGGVYSRVVTQPTKYAADGTVANIPDNADWLHEWQTHWVELWIKASDAMYFTDAGCTLNYNSEYFTATGVELSPAFAGLSKAIIQDELGQVTGIGGKATKLVKSDGYILLGRVKFESRGDDNVPFEEASFAHDLGISLSNVLVRSSTNESFSRVGNSPKTELWAVPYDVNDDGCVGLDDFAYFANAFRQSGEANTLSASLYDYDKDGYVTINDFAYFSNLFGYNRLDDPDSLKEIKFPETFTQRYVGKTLDANDTAAVNKIIDTANKAWQSALGLDRPVEIQIVVQDFGDSPELANARITAVDDQGRPLKGIIVIDDDGAGMGWYSQIAEPVANSRYDLYTTLLHEMGHVYGYNINYDAFGEVAGLFDKAVSSGHATNENDVMFATLATGVRKTIQDHDVSVINSAYAKAADGSIGFKDEAAALTAGDSFTPDQTAFVEQESGVLMTTLNLPSVAFAAPSVKAVDADTATQLHAMGLAVTMPISLQQKEENRVSLTIDQVYGENSSLFDLSDDDLMTLHQPQDVDESELALIDLTLDLDV